MEQHRGRRRSRQDVFNLINDRFKESKEESFEEMRREAKARAEEQRRKEALLAQMHPEWQRHPSKDEAKAAQQIPSPKRGRAMQATVETDTEESPGTTTAGHDRANMTQSVPRKEGDVGAAAAAKKHKEPSPSLEKREGGYTHAPPLEFARETVGTRTLPVQPPKSASTIRSHSGRSKKKCVAVWSGDEVQIVDVEVDGLRKATPPRVRLHRRTF